MEKSVIESLNMSDPELLSEITKMEQMFSMIFSKIKAIETLGDVDKCEKLLEESCLESNLTTFKIPRYKQPEYYFALGMIAGNKQLLLKEKRRKENES